jgi:uncharacterized membrane protein
MVAMMFWHGAARSPNDCEQGGDARRILDERVARGEIDAEATRAAENDRQTTRDVPTS